MDVICKCGKEFKTYLSRIAVGRGKYCSKKCHYLDGWTETICKNCSKKFKHIKGHKYLFCSNKCVGNHNTGVKSSQYKHGLRHTRFWIIWRNMNSRCRNPKNSDWRNYGGKGIKVHSDWRNFIDFRNDMYQSYLSHINQYGEKNTTIDRLDSNDDYYKGNCRWATNKEQQNNRSTNRLIEYSGRTQTLKAWSEELGIHYNRISGRLCRNWPLELAFSKEKFMPGKRTKQAYA